MTLSVHRTLEAPLRTGRRSPRAAGPSPAARRPFTAGAGGACAGWRRSTSARWSPCPSWPSPPGFPGGFGALGDALARPVPGTRSSSRSWPRPACRDHQRGLRDTLAYVLVRFRFPGRGLLGALVDLPFAIPTLVTGVMLAALYGPNSPVGRFLDRPRDPDHLRRPRHRAGPTGRDAPPRGPDRRAGPAGAGRVPGRGVSSPGGGRVDDVSQDRVPRHPPGRGGRHAPVLRPGHRRVRVHRDRGRQHHRQDPRPRRCSSFS